MRFLPFQIAAVILIAVISSDLAAAGEQSEDALAEHWATDDRDLILLTGRDGSRNWVCPFLPGRATQPFCRRFETPVLTACGRRDRIQIVLASGEIHRVDFAMIGTDGGFDPVFRPRPPLALSSAWIPRRDCDLTGGSANVIAVDRAGELLHFDGEKWQSLELPRISSRNEPQIADQRE